MEKRTTLSYKIDTILLYNILDILEKTKGCKKARDYAIAYICRCCCNILTNKKMKKEEKIDSFKKITKKCVDDVDNAIDKYNKNVEKTKNITQLLPDYFFYEENNVVGFGSSTEQLLDYAANKYMEYMEKNESGLKYKQGDKQ